MRHLVPIALLACNAERPEPARPVTPMPAAAEVAPLARASNAFAIELWKAAAHQPGNLAMSPASISFALAMTLPGAGGETAAEIQQVSHLDSASRALAWGKVAAALQSGDRKLELRIANRLFGQQGYRFEHAYLDMTKQTFDAPLEPVDFKAHATDARTTINRWVEQRTAQKIKDLLPAGAIDDRTRLVIANAIYFHATWASPFEKRATSDEPFHLDAKTDKPVPTMHDEASFRYAKVPGAAILELPYQNDEAAMLVVLPDRVDGLAELEASLDATAVATWTAALQSDHVEVALPKFVIDPREPISLRDALSTLGIHHAFDAKTADFFHIATPPDPAQALYISAVLHKAFVKVDEKGTEAAAATAVVTAGAGAAPPGKTFHADHPFLFAVVDRATGLVLFLGRVVDPKAS